MFSCSIKHSTTPRALLNTRLHISCFKTRKALSCYFNYYIYMATWLVWGSLRLAPIIKVNPWLQSADVSTGTYHPYLPQTFRFTTFELLHSLSHPGVKASRLHTSGLTWRPTSRSGHVPVNNVNILCTTKSLPATLACPDARFNHVYVNIVGPLPPWGFNYLFTVIDRSRDGLKLIPFLTLLLGLWLRHFSVGG